MYVSQGYEIIWPIFSVYKNIQDKIEISSGIKFYNLEENFPLKDLYKQLCRREINEVSEHSGVLYVPIKMSFHSSWGHSLQRFESHDASNMFAKFLMCGTTHDNWQDYFQLKRDKKREQSLIDYLSIKRDVHLVQKIFGTPPTWMETLNKTIKTPENLQRIEVSYIDGFDVFDWLGVYELASKIDVVSTSSFYFFEKLNLNCKPTIYSRNTTNRSYSENFDWLKKLAKKEYNYIS